jgi:hypothetical protein
LKHAAIQWLPISVGGHRSWTLPGTKSKRFPFLALDPGLPKDAHQQAATDVLGVRIRDPKFSSAPLHVLASAAGDSKPSARRQAIRSFLLIGATAGIQATSRISRRLPSMSGIGE